MIDFYLGARGQRVIKALLCSAGTGLMVLLGLTGCGDTAGRPHLHGVPPVPAPQTSSPATVATPTVLLTWEAPSLNSDGTPLTDIAGYRLYYGQASRQ
jgi:hypothetical protein